MLAATSVSLHGLVLLLAPQRAPRDLAETATLSQEVKVTQFSCTADAWLGAAFRGFACTVPGLNEPKCTHHAWEDLQLDRLVCHGLKQNIPEDAQAVSYITEEELKDLKPAPLLEVAPIDDEDAQTLAQKEQVAKEEEAQERIANPKEKGQVIEVTAPEVEIAPEKARFLSEYDTAVDVETVARGSTEEMVAKPSPKELPIAKANPQAENEVREQGNSDGSGGKAQSQLAMRAQKSRAEKIAGHGAFESNAGVAIGQSGNDIIDQKGQAAHEGVAAQAQGGGGDGNKPWLNLRPSTTTLSRLAGGGSVDRLEGVQSGDFTALNSKKWRYATFFNRMKRQVAQNWRPAQVYARRDPTGRVYGQKDRVTVLDVSLTEDGALADVIVRKESGVEFLDDEAVRAFQSSQPFPNPPSALLDESRRITFQFGFYFQVRDRGGSWKIFRYE